MKPSSEEVELKDDLIMGADAIADFLGMSRRQVYGCIERQNLPGFKIGGHVCIRRSVVMKWIAQRERMPG